MITTYLAGKMSGEIDNGYPLFDAARDFLFSLGLNPISPADMDRLDGITETSVIEPFTDAWRARLRKDAAQIALSDRISFLPNWVDSAGARLERRIGYELGIPFWRVDPIAEMYSPEMVVGLAGYATVGKDAAAEALETQGWVRRGFAETLRELLYATNPAVDAIWRIKDLVDRDGWTAAKQIAEVRQLLQRLGTEGGRSILGDDFWIRSLFAICTAPKITIPDVRFPNEARAIEDRGGVVIRIERPGRGPVNGHLSETAMDGYGLKHTIQNSGTIESLGQKVLEIVNDHYQTA